MPLGRQSKYYMSRDTRTIFICACAAYCFVTLFTIYKLEFRSGSQYSCSFSSASCSFFLRILCDVMKYGEYGETGSHVDCMSHQVLIDGAPEHSVVLRSIDSMIAGPSFANYRDRVGDNSSIMPLHPWGG